MPYITQGQRRQLAEDLDELDRRLARAEDHPGNLNYVITYLVNRFVERRGGNYAAHSAAHGVLADVQMEHYRRRTAPYEDTKIVENGDVA